MGYCRLGLAAVAALGLLIAAEQDPASAAGVLTLAALQADASVRPVPALPVAFHHHGRRTQSYYCYPKNYWWFYRPYTTAYDNHRSLHALFPLFGARPGRQIRPVHQVAGRLPKDGAANKQALTLPIP